MLQAVEKLAYLNNGYKKHNLHLMAISILSFKLLLNFIFKSLLNISVSFAFFSKLFLVSYEVKFDSNCCIFHGRNTNYQ